jgi:hypothetical protein
MVFNSSRFSAASSAFCGVNERNRAPALDQERRRRGEDTPYGEHDTCRIAPSSAVRLSSAAIQEYV